jgi:hypothetical protein
MEEKEQTVFNEKVDLNDNQRKDFLFVKERIEALKKTRANHYGMNLDKLWADADRDYVPHRLKSNALGTEEDSSNVIATDEDRGWRGAIVNIGSPGWQSDISQSNPFIKIGVALSILVDQNPKGVFTPMVKKFQATTELMKQLYQRSWEVARSNPQLKLFVFNLAKYGWAVIRTYPLKIEREVNVVESLNDDQEPQYKKEKVIEYNDVYRENLDPRNVWIDDMAKPNNPMSVRDWTFRKVYDMDTDEFEREFGKSKLYDKVKKGGTTSELVSSTKGTQKKFQGKNLVEVYFYESRAKDMFWVLANGVPVQMEHLPISDARGSKKLSLSQTYWNLRHSESPYGIGIYEAIRYENAMQDRISNMTLDQLTLSIYKMFFYQGTQTLQDTGDITIVPGLGKQMLDPKNINWLEVPGPGAEAWQGIELLKQRLDEASGVMEPLGGGSPTRKGKGKITAFQIAQEKEMALRRLKNPLDNILEALNEEAYITISLCQLLYSIPETYEITDPRLIEDYLAEVKNDPELFEEDVQDGQPRKLTAKVYPEMPLNLDKDNEGNLTETKDTKFFRIKPKFLDWEGIIQIKAESILTASKQVDKAMGLEFYNIYVPIIGQLAQQVGMMMQSGQPIDLDELPFGKIAKLLPKLYDKDPRDLLPNSWVAKPKEQQQGNAQSGTQQPLFVQQGQQQGQQGQQPQQGPQQQGQKVVPQQQPGLGQRIMQGIGNIFKGGDQ